MAREHGWSQENVTLWLVNATGFFDDGRPVDHLDDDERVLRGALRHLDPLDPGRWYHLLYAAEMM